MNTKILNLAIILVIIVAGTLGYFLFVRKSPPTKTSQVPTSSNATQKTCSDIAKIDLGGIDWEHGIKIQKKGNERLSLTTGEWVKNDPVCCPSQQKESLFHSMYYFGMGTLGFHSAFRICDVSAS